MPQLVIYSRHACHLCEVMLAELQALIGDLEISIEQRDVDSRTQWQRDYGPRVPVLTDNAGNTLSEYRLDQDRVLAWLASTQSGS